MLDLYWEDRAWEEYCEWQIDKKMLKRINTILKDIQRNGYTGIGKPEPLKANRSGYWSRRIDEKHRIVYKIENNYVKIVACKNHYDE